MAEKAIKELLDGYKRFYAEHFEKNPKLYQNFVKHGQAPKTMVISCSDSRVDPAIVLDADPGELFIVRNVANLVPTYQYQDHACSVAAALLYAVDVLEVDNIIVLGLSHCGGVQALMKADEDIDPEHQGIRDWANIASAAKGITMLNNPKMEFVDLCHKCEYVSIKCSLANLLTYPWLEKRFKEDDISLHGWLFDLESGEIRAYDNGKDEFLPV